MLSVAVNVSLIVANKSCQNYAEQLFIDMASPNNHPKKVLTRIIIGKLMKNFIKLLICNKSR